MGLDGFESLFAGADARVERATVAVAGDDDRTVLAALRVAAGRGWVQPIIVGPESRINAIAKSDEIDLAGLEIHDVQGPEIASTAVNLVRSGRARALMKGQIPTPELMRAILDPKNGLR